MEYIQSLKSEFYINRNKRNAVSQKAYMRNKFDFLGMTSPVRKEVQKPFLVQKYLPESRFMQLIVKQLWQQPEREFQYFAQEFSFKYVKHFIKNDIALLEYMITHKSWWDTVDFIASKLVGNYMKIFPEQQQKYIDKWIDSNDIWLQRTAILFQLKYKDDTDTQLLSYVINRLKNTNEFFLNKAIGWILREYAKTNPDWVVQFVRHTQLHKLSKKEALRLIKK